MSLKQLRNRRLIHGISKRKLAREMDCSYSWADFLDRQMYRGPALPKWEKRYTAALEKLIADQEHQNGDL